MIKAILNFLFRFKRKQDGEVKRILFLCPSSAVGDSVVETFFIRELKKLYPSASLDIFIRQPYGIIFEGNPNINKILLMPVKPLKKMLYVAFKTFYLRAQKYDLLIDIPWSGYAPWRYIFLYFIGAKKVMAANVSGYNFINYSLTWAEGDKHITEEVFTKALKMLGAKEPFDLAYNLYLPQEEERRAKEFSAPYKQAAKKIMLINGEGSSLQRTLAQDNMSAILEGLSSLSGWQLVLVQYKKLYKLPAGAVIYASASVMGAAAIIKEADYLLTVDTGLGHIADAFNVPRTTLFCEVTGHDNAIHPKAWFCWGSKYKFNKKLRDFKSVNGIASADIVNCVKEHLAEAGGK